MNKWEFLKLELQKKIAQIDLIKDVLQREQDNKQGHDYNINYDFHERQQEELTAKQIALYEVQMMILSIEEKENAE